MQTLVNHFWLILTVASTLQYCLEYVLRPKSRTEAESAAHQCKMTVDRYVVVMRDAFFHSGVPRTDRGWSVSEVHPNLYGLRVTRAFGDVGRM